MLSTKEKIRRINLSDKVKIKKLREINRVEFLCFCVVILFGTLFTLLCISLYCVYIGSYTTTFAVIINIFAIALAFMQVHIHKKIKLAVDEIYDSI
jgi:hypothetical protein